MRQFPEYCRVLGDRAEHDGEGDRILLETQRIIKATIMMLEKREKKMPEFKKEPICEECHKNLASYFLGNQEMGEIGGNFPARNVSLIHWNILLR